MGEPTRGNARGAFDEHIVKRGARGELKLLSTLRNRKNSLSSGERKGKSLNLIRVSGGRCVAGVERFAGGSHPTPRSKKPDT